MANDLNRFTHDLKAQIGRIRQLVNRTLPIKSGRMARQHIRENFRQGGFVDHGLKSWTPAKRLSAGGSSADSRRGTLMSSRKHLYNSTRYTTAPAKVTLFNDVVYASIHQNGGDITIPITKKMRSYAWARYFAANGIKKGDKERPKISEEEEKGKEWKGLALTSKETLKVTMPARPFMGPSHELNEKIGALIERELENLFNH